MKKYRTIALLLGALALGVAACSGGPKPGAIGPDGYRHPVYAYGVLHRPGEQLLPAEWLLDNYYFSQGRIQPKRAPEYLTQLELDLNSDGVYDDTVEAFVYDLLFINQRTSAQIFARTVPLSYESANLELDVIAQRVANELAGGDFRVVQFGGGARPGYQVVEKKRYVVSVEKLGAVTLAGLDAVEATFAVGNADRPDPPEVKLRFVFCRPGFQFVHQKRGRRFHYPVLFIAGYRALPHKFDTNVPDFERFLSSVALGSGQGYIGLPDVTAPAAASAPQAAAEADAGTAPETPDEPTPETTDAGTESPAPLAAEPAQPVSNQPSKALGF